MAIQQPISSDFLNSPDHSLSHRVFANDSAAPIKSVVVDAAGDVYWKETIRMATNPVSEEIPINSGDNINFTIAHTPITGRFQLFRGGSRITVGAGDYTLTGTALVLTVALATGESLTCDYEY